MEAFQAAPHSFQHFNFWLASMVVFFFVVQPSITRIGLRFFACSQNEDMGGKQFLQTDFAVECHTSSHYQWAILVGVPTLVAYGAGVPLLALAVLRRVTRDGDSVEEALKKWRAVFGQVLTSPSLPPSKTLSLKAVSSSLDHHTRQVPV